MKKGDSELLHFVTLRAKPYSCYRYNHIANTVNIVKCRSNSFENNKVTFKNLYNVLLDRNSEKDRIQTLSDFIIKVIICILLMRIN